MFGVSLPKILPCDLSTHLCYDMALENAFPTEEGVVARSLRRKRDRSGVKRGEFLIDIEVVENDSFRTLGGFGPEEKKTYRAARFDKDRRRIEPTLHMDLNLLHTSASDHPAPQRWPRAEEEPKFHPDEYYANGKDEDIGHESGRLVLVILDPEVRDLAFPHQPP